MKGSVKHDMEALEKVVKESTCVSCNLDGANISKEQWERIGKVAENIKFDWSHLTEDCPVCGEHTGYDILYHGGGACGVVFDCGHEEYTAKDGSVTYGGVK